MPQLIKGLSPSYLSPKAKVMECSFGKGLFAAEKISKGELIIDWESGPGLLLSTKESYEMEAAGNKYTLQIDDDLHLVSVHIVEECDYINHSCDPNCGFKNAYQIVALRDIPANEELFFDYAMSEAAECFLLECQCGSKKCRKTITGNDWKIKSLQNRYQNHFSPYILRKIKKERA